MKILSYFLILTIYSCANLGLFNYESVHIGTHIKQTLSKTGKPIVSYKEGIHSYHFFESGLIVEKEERVIFRSEYQGNSQNTPKISEFIKAGMNAGLALSELYIPKDIKELSDHSLLVIYQNGSVLIKNNKIVSITEDIIEKNTKFDIRISTWRLDNFKEDGYYYINANHNITPKDLNFLEFKKHIKKVLEQKGIKTTDNASNATYFVSVNFGISDPIRETHIDSRPINNFSYNPGNSTNLYNNKGTHIGSMKSEGTFENRYVGQSTSSYTVVNYSRWLDIEITAPTSKSNQHSVFWKVSMESTGSSNDIRMVLPAFLYSLSSHLFKDDVLDKKLSFNSEELNEYFNLIRHFHNLDQPKRIPSSK